MARTFEVLENSPAVLNSLSTSLGLSPTLSFHEVYSLTDPNLLALIPRPVYALLAIIPLTPTWAAHRRNEDAQAPPNDAEEEGILWFKQTIPRACGSIGFLHCALNGEAASFVEPGSALSSIAELARPLRKKYERARVLENSEAFHAAHAVAARQGDSRPLRLAEGERVGQHFVAFVKAGGRLWELEGTRGGALNRGMLGEEEDALSEAAVRMGLRRIMEMESGGGGGELRFSCLALAPRE